jgi:hypothetical protein
LVGVEGLLLVVLLLVLLLLRRRQQIPQCRSGRRGATQQRHPWC